MTAGVTIITPAWGRPMSSRRTSSTGCLAFFENARRRHAGKNVLAVTHGDIIIFTILWARGLALSAENKVNPHAFGFKGYPATGSLTAFIFRTDSQDELPEVRHLQPALMSN